MEFGTPVFRVTQYCELRNHAFGTSGTLFISLMRIISTCTSIEFNICIFIPNLVLKYRSDLGPCAPESPVKFGGHEA